MVEKAPAENEKRKQQFVDDAEMAEILANRKLMKRIEKDMSLIHGDTESGPGDSFMKLMMMKKLYSSSPHPTEALPTDKRNRNGFFF